MKRYLTAPLTLYVIGYVLSLVLTIMVFALVIAHGRLEADQDPGQTILLIVALAVAQLIVQAIFFLHLGAQEQHKPRWHSASFLLMIFVMLFIVIGSIWVMNNLDYNMMPRDHSQSIMDDEGIHAH